MPQFDSVNWDWEIGVCRKHMLPQVPCPACIAQYRAGGGKEEQHIVDILTTQPLFFDPDPIPRIWIGEDEDPYPQVDIE
jgi:hypothetical protein